MYFQALFPDSTQSSPIIRPIIADFVEFHVSEKLIWKNSLHVHAGYGKEMVLIIVSLVSKDLENSNQLATVYRIIFLIGW
jgi:hypothetical protein